MISRVSRKNKGKQAKMKNSVKKQNKQRKKGTKKKTENNVAGSRNLFIICTCKQLLDHCTAVTHDLKI